MGRITYHTKTLSIYPFHDSGAYTYAWVFRRDGYGRPVLRSLRIRRIRKYKVGGPVNGR